MLNIVPNRNIVKFVASSTQAMAGGANPITASSKGQRLANFSIADGYQIMGQVRSDQTGTLNIYQGFSDDNGATVKWVTVTAVTVTGASIVDGSGATFKIDIVGEICKIDFVNSGSSTNNFELAAWYR
jgi:hypothetical protein